MELAAPVLFGLGGLSFALFNLFCRLSCNLVWKLRVLALVCWQVGGYLRSFAHPCDAAIGSRHFVSPCHRLIDWQAGGQTEEFRAPLLQWHLSAPSWFPHCHHLIQLQAGRRTDGGVSHSPFAAVITAAILFCHHLRVIAVGVCRPSDVCLCPALYCGLELFQSPQLQTRFAGTLELFATALPLSCEACLGQLLS